MTTRAIIDYAEDDNAVAMRDALYSDIMDRVNSHIEAKKQEVAQNLISNEDYEEYEEE
jgi:hypothetical protein